jgi:hypothetical protein
MDPPLVFPGLSMQPPLTPVENGGKNLPIFFPDDPTEPDLTLQPPSFLVSVEYNIKDPNILAGLSLRKLFCLRQTLA